MEGGVYAWVTLCYSVGGDSVSNPAKALSGRRIL